MLGRDFMSNRLANKVAIITGAGGGIGAASVRAFVAQGAKVVATDINADAVLALASELGDAVHAMAHDTANEAQWQDVVAAATSKFGALHILVNNAGIGHGSRLTQTTLDEWRGVMAVNLDGVFLGTKYAIPAMVKSGNGSIINISSVDSKMGAPLRVPYCASKGGVESFTKAAAMECCEFGEPVRINSVHPGPVATNIFASALPKVDPALVALLGGGDGVAAYYLRNTPLTRFALPEEIAHAIVYLASDESAFVTGTSMVIDGGFSAGKLMNQRMPEGM
jgi:NAD(P)-dependent dehydrogenase (short-subunit alcohol dehydrogenase family)